jgi:hypothetical protein
MLSMQMPLQSNQAQEHGALRVKNTFVDAEELGSEIQRLEELSWFWRQESEPAFFNTVFTRTATARKSFVAATLLCSDEHHNKSIGAFGEKVAGHSLTISTMDDLGDDEFDCDGSVSDQSSDHEWEACDVLGQSEEEPSEDRKDDLWEHSADVTDPIDVHEQPRDITDALSLTENVEGLSRQLSTVSVASGDFCRQTTEDFWPRYCSADSKCAVEGEQHGAMQTLHLVGAMPPCDASVTPVMWPMLPVVANSNGNVNPMVFGASKQNASEPAMSKPRKNRRTFNPNSLISLAEQAQQRRREEQQFKMQQQIVQWKQLHGIQMRQKQQQVHSAPARNTEPNACTPKFCPHCGKGIRPDFKCCPFCGSSIPAAVAAHQKSS